MRRLSPIEFANIALAGLSEAERIGVCRRALREITRPTLANALRDAGHQIARTADELDRLFAEQSSGMPRGQCLPEHLNLVSGHSAPSTLPDPDPDLVKDGFVEGVLFHGAKHED